MEVLGIEFAVGWIYVAIAVVVAVDAFFPLVPGETVLITGAVLAGRGEAWLPGVLAAAIGGALAGDHFSYLLGRLLGGRAARRLFRSEKSRGRLQEATRLLDRRGTVVIVGARFVPGGRTAATFACGLLRMPLRRFTPADAIGVVLWCSYAAAAGYIGGEAVGGSVLLPLAAVLGGVFVLALVVEELHRRSRSAGRPSRPEV